jgi:hypothetical protein
MMEKRDNHNDDGLELSQLNLDGSSDDRDLDEEIQEKAEDEEKQRFKFYVLRVALTVYIANGFAALLGLGIDELLHNVISNAINSFFPGFGSAFVCLALPLTGDVITLIRLTVTYFQDRKAAALRESVVSQEAIASHEEITSLNVDFSHEVGGNEVGENKEPNQETSEPKKTPTLEDRS